MLRNLERLVERRVKARVREEFKCAMDRLEWHMTPEEVIPWRVSSSTRRSHSVRQ